MTAPSTASQTAETVLAAYSERRQIAPFSESAVPLDLGEAYRVAAMVRARRESAGERVVGRKIGFTNRTIWAEYGVFAPIWGYVYDTTLVPLSEIGAGFGLSRVVEPRIEPEIVLRLSQAPRVDMDEGELLACVDVIAQGFEIVQSLFPAWRFSAADTVAGFGLHGALLLGEPVPIAPQRRDEWARALSGFEITLLRDGVEIDQGRADNVLGGGPLVALRHLVAVLAADPDAPPLAAGEIVTTGTLTRAWPVAPGERWETRLSGIDLPGIAARLA